MASMNDCNDQYGLKGVLLCLQTILHQEIIRSSINLLLSKVYGHLKCIELYGVAASMLNHSSIQFFPTADILVVRYPIVPIGGSLWINDKCSGLQKLYKG